MVVAHFKVISWCLPWETKEYDENLWADDPRAEISTWDPLNTKPGRGANR
jgi:hypothetical protein